MDWNIMTHGYIIIHGSDTTAVSEVDNSSKTEAGEAGYMINPRVDGPLDFPPPAGGCLNTPHLSRLLRIVEQNKKRRSKAREK